MRPPAQRRDTGPSLYARPRKNEPEFTPRVLAGVDEAGFGPLLGPLTIGAVALRAPDGMIDPWKRLEPLVGREDERNPACLAVGDSKAVFARNDVGRARLERTALVFHAQVHGLPEHGRAFLGATRPPLACDALEGEFWHALLPARLAPVPEDLSALVTSLAAALRAAPLEVACCSVRAVPACELNASFARTDSKGTTHWEQCAPLLVHLWQAFASEGLELVVDRHGGRMRYANLLETTFARADVVVESEKPERSIYHLRDDDGRSMRITFAEKADHLSFPVALASCLAKYARELCMEAFNAHFGALQPGLAPTAGYRNDAWRWLAEAGPAITCAGLAPSALVRTR